MFKGINPLKKTHAANIATWHGIDFFFLRVHRDGSEMSLNENGWKQQTWTTAHRPCHEKSHVKTQYLTTENHFRSFCRIHWLKHAPLWGHFFVPSCIENLDSKKSLKPIICLDMGFPKNQSLVSDRNVARCRGEGRSGFTKQNNFRIKMIYGCIEDISITENFDAPKDRSWKNAASSMRSGKRLGGIPGSTRGPLSFGNVSISLCDEKPNEKGFKNTLFHFSWKEYHPTSWIQQCIYMHLERFLQGNHLPMTTLSKQLRHFVFKDARNRSSEFIQGHEDIIRSFHADLNLWSFHFCSFQFNEVFEKLRFLLHASQKNLEALVKKKQNRNLGFYWKKRYGVLPFSMNNTMLKTCKFKDVNGKYVFSLVKTS